MLLKQYTVNAFTERQFGGNPAAVLVTESFLSDDLMQQIAAQNNLSETAFAVQRGGVYDIRWFSPLTEIDFCGHATLATAYVLRRFYGMAGRLVFYCDLLGEFEVLVDEGDAGRISMSFPERAPVPLDEIPSALLDGLSEPPREIWRSAQAYFAIYDNEQTVRDLHIATAPLKTLAPFDVVATALGTGDADFVSRYFWPANGGDEDPVTGSIHAGLFPFWGKRLQKTQMTARQVSARGGELYGVCENGRVQVSGYAVLFAKSELDLNGETE